MLVAVRGVANAVSDEEALRRQVLAYVLLELVGERFDARVAHGQHLLGLEAREGDVRVIGRGTCVRVLVEGEKR